MFYGSRFIEMWQLGYPCLPNSNGDRIERQIIHDSRRLHIKFHNLVSPNKSRHIVRPHFSKMGQYHASSLSPNILATCLSLVDIIHIYACAVYNYRAFWHINEQRRPEVAYRSAINVCVCYFEVESKALTCDVLFCMCKLNDYTLEV